MLLTRIFMRTTEAATMPLGDSLTRAQLGIWLGHQRADDPSVFGAVECLVPSGRFDADLLAAAIRETHAEATALHVRFQELDGEPRCVRATPPLDLTFATCPDEAALFAMGRAEAHRAFDLDRGPLQRHRIVRLGDGRHAWLHAAHHIALDGYGFQLFARRVLTRYETLNRPAEPSGFTELAPVRAEDEAYRGSEAEARDREFWAHALGDLGPLGFPPLDSAVAHPIKHRRVIDPVLFGRVLSTARAAGLGWPDLGLAAIAEALGAQAGARRFVLGLPAMLRMGTAAVRTPCMAMNVVPLVVDRRVGSVLTLAAELRDRRRRQARHQRYRYEALRAERGDSVFAPAVNLLPFERVRTVGGHPATTHTLATGPVENLALSLAAAGDSMELVVDAHPSLASESALEAFADTLVRSLEQTAAPRAQVSAALDHDPLARFFAIADSAPERPVLVEGDREWTRGELAAEVRERAAALRAEGLGPGVLRPLDRPRSANAILELLAIVASGAAYVPLAEDLPAARRRAILDATGDASGDGSRAPTSADPAYVVFTSGSTGEPRGVEISRRALARFVDAASDRYGIGPDDRVLQFAPLSFDASVEEIFVTLAVGATLVLRSNDALESMERFLAECADARTTVLDLPTAFWHELCLALRQRALSLPSSVRSVIIGGEAALPERLEHWFDAGGPPVLNTYGPSEATVVATAARIEGPGGVPIGQPLAGVEALIARGGRVVDGPAEGELLLAGPTLATGYLGDERATHERFVLLPGHGRAYRTGDRVRRDDDGTLHFLGRVDDELKISGHRVRPTEVEAVLARHPLVRAVIVRATEGPIRRLVAHVEADATLTAEAVRAQVRRFLPEPMVPTAVAIHERLPRNASGKLDRRALTLPSDPVAPEVLGAIEQRVLEAWVEVLGVRARLDDDFFAIGGSSLQAIQLANRLAQRGIEVRVAQLFEHPTVRAQGALLSGGGRASGAFEPLPTTLGFERAHPPTDARAALLTGATGYVGIELLHGWLTRTAEPVVCVVRADDASHAWRRLVERAQTNGLDLEPHRARIDVVAADLTERSERLNTLPPCGVVLHAAASVNLARTYESLHDANVGATARMLDLAARWGAEMHLVSTLATLPADAPTEEIHPSHAGLVDGYQRSKWHAEALAAEAAARGLRVAIHRLGRVTGPRREPRINTTDLLWRVVRAAARSGAWPDLPFRESWIPSDDAALAIVDLLAAGAATTPASAYHLAHPGYVEPERVRTALEAVGLPLETIPLTEWTDRVLRSDHAEDVATAAWFEQRASAELAAVERVETRRLLARAPHLSTTVIEDALLDAYCRDALGHR